MKLMKLFVAVVFAAMWNTSYAQEEPKSTLDQVMEKMEPRNIGPAGMSGRVTCIAVHPDRPTTIYAGAASGGLWVSENNGQTWSPIFENEAVASVGAIAIDPKHPDIIYVGTGE